MDRNLKKKTPFGSNLELFKMDLKINQIYEDVFEI